VHDKCMAVKTITIDLDAYDALARQKKPGQSFSQVIKAHFGPRKTVAAFRRSLRATVVSDHTLNAVESLVRSRKKSTARMPTL
jgi:predicted CopG family antitoxin